MHPSTAILPSTGTGFFSLVRHFSPMGLISSSFAVVISMLASVVDEIIPMFVLVSAGIIVETSKRIDLNFITRIYKWFGKNTKREWKKEKKSIVYWDLIQYFLKCV